MTTQHTPGPWKSRNGFESNMKEIYAPNPKIKKPFMPVQLADVRAECKEGKANARLIAAAPELLEALKALSCTARTFRNVPQEKQCWTPIDDEALEAAFNAISKATGEAS